MSAEHVERTASRVLLLNGQDEVLLLRGVDPGDHTVGSWWFTPGGGLDPGEDPVVGAARELFEETGLRIPPSALDGPVYAQLIEFPFEGARYRQFERFYVARVPAWEVDVRGFTDVEQRSVIGHRWWSLAQLRQTDDRVYPAQLPSLLADVLSATAGEEA